MISYSSYQTCKYTGFFADGLKAFDEDEAIEYKKMHRPNFDVHADRPDFLFANTSRRWLSIFYLGVWLGPSQFYYSWVSRPGSFEAFDLDLMSECDTKTVISPPRLTCKLCGSKFTGPNFFDVEHIVAEVDGFFIHDACKNLNNEQASTLKSIHDSLSKKDLTVNRCGSCKNYRVLVRNVDLKINKIKSLLKDVEKDIKIASSPDIVNKIIQFQKMDVLKSKRESITLLSRAVKQLKPLTAALAIKEYANHN